MQVQCKFVNPETGEKCQGFALESGYCFSHDPAKKEDKLIAVTKGGLAPKKLKLSLPAVHIETVEDVISVLEETVNAVRGGMIPCSNPTNTIGFLCSHILKAIELSKVDTKLDSIDRIILEKRMSQKLRK